MFNQFIQKLPLLNFCTSITALTFQIMVLYPCNKNLSIKIDNINKLLENSKMKI
jgi:hypothetical protein